MTAHPPITHTLPIRVAQLNAQRNKNTVINLLNEYTESFDIILLQEPPWFKIGSDNSHDILGSVQLQGWTPISPTTTSANPPRPRTFTYVKKRPDFSVTLRTDLIEAPDVQILDV